MSEQISWYLARAGGLVAWSALAASAILGLVLAGKLIPRRNGPWVQEVHQYLGGLATTFTAIHLAALVADNYVYFGWKELFLPFASEWEPWSVAAGIVAFYALVAVEVTSLARRHLPRRLWKGVHHLSLPLFGFSTLHGFMAGEDASGNVYMAVTLGVCAAVGLTAMARHAFKPRGRRYRRMIRPTAG